MLTSFDVTEIICNNTYLNVQHTIEQHVVNASIEQWHALFSVTDGRYFEQML